jgi:hypothetical protein
MLVSAHRGRPAVATGDDILTFDRLMQRTAVEYVEIAG